MDLSPIAREILELSDQAPESYFCAFRFRLNPTPGQRQAFSRAAGCKRVVYNRAVADWQENRQRFAELHEAGIVPDAAFRASLHPTGAFDRNKLLLAMKAEFPWLSDVPSQCLQQAHADFAVAVDRFFRGLGSQPVFKGKYEGDSFRFPQGDKISIDYAKSEIRLPKFWSPEGTKGRRKGDHGPIKVVFHRRIRGRIRSATIRREADGWYVSIVTALAPKHPMVRNVVADKLKGLEVGHVVTEDDLVIIGVDRGVANKAVLSEAIATFDLAGHPVVTDTFGRDVLDLVEIRRQARLQRRLARKDKGSKNRRRAKHVLARHQAKLARRRRDWTRKAAKALVAAADVIVLEDLKVTNMSKSAKGTHTRPGRNVAQKAGLNRGIQDSAWGMFREAIELDAKAQGRKVLYVNPAYTSQTCAECGHVAKGNRRTQALFACLACGHEDHADRNAARAIRGLAIAGKLAERSRITPGDDPLENPAGGAPVAVCGGEEATSHATRAPRRATGETDGVSPSGVIPPEPRQSSRALTTKKRKGTVARPPETPVPGCCPASGDRSLNG